MNVVINNAGMEELTRSPAGGIGRHLVEIGEKVWTDAYRNAGGRHHGFGLGGRGPRRRTGLLQDSIIGPTETGVLQDSRSLYVVVGTDASRRGIHYPRLQELGGFAFSRRYQDWVEYQYPFLIPALLQNGFTPY